MRIAKSHHAMADDQGHHRIGTVDLAMHPAHGRKHIFGPQRHIDGTLQLVSQHVEQHLGIGSRIDMTTSQTGLLLAQLLGIGQVTIVRQGNTEW